MNIGRRPPAAPPPSSLRRRPHHARRHFQASLRHNMIRARHGALDLFRRATRRRAAVRANVFDDRGPFVDKAVGVGDRVGEVEDLMKRKGMDVVSKQESTHPRATPHPFITLTFLPVTGQRSFLASCMPATGTTSSSPPAAAGASPVNASSRAATAAPTSPSSPPSTRSDTPASTASKSVPRKGLAAAAGGWYAAAARPSPRAARRAARCSSSADRAAAMTPAASAPAWVRPSARSVRASVAAARGPD